MYTPEGRQPCAERVGPTPDTRGAHAGHTRGTRGAHAGHTRGTRGAHAGHTRGTRGAHAGHTRGTRGAHAGHTRGTRGAHAGHTRGTHWACVVCSSTEVQRTPSAPWAHTKRASNACPARRAFFWRVPSVCVACTQRVATGYINASLPIPSSLLVFRRRRCLCPTTRHDEAVQPPGYDAARAHLEIPAIPSQEGRRKCLRHPCQ